ncbi:Oidioi.mRNA.OKI2018_I69.chr2.g6668.t1.cds [Oikopleura dioica]|uniref:Oidioi.mRNA.OKI2018_I69.chr2.g6668.t1.cds n=1 Tax=Oikopleura dioica TaxID=34765 RepID=A0ABN7T4E4_OIKDI|nr:Oidioi.mRNA.OKI2018_I69.chr2.g6668.t1.cds [Oikopleura dioica]
MRNASGSTLAYSLLVIGLGILGFIIHEQKDDLRVIHTIAAVTKELENNQNQLVKQYDQLIEVANKIALNVEEDHNIITDSHEYLHRKNVRIRGLPEIEGRALIDMFRELVTKKLGLVLEDMDIDLAQWAGPSLQDGTRPAVVTFAQYAMKNKVLEKARLKLRDSPYVLFEDLFVGNGENLTELAHQRGVDACYKHISKISAPSLHKTSGMPFGAWFNDMGNSTDKTVFFMDHYFKERNVKFFNSTDDFTKDNFAGTFLIPLRWAGTGHVAYKGSLYFTKYNTTTMYRYDWANRKVLTTRELSGAGFANQAAYQWRGSTDIDFAVDENGLWVIYATEANNWNIVLSKLNEETLEIKETFNTGWKKQWSANAFMLCGTLYVLKKYDEKQTYIHYSFDTKSGRASRPMIPFSNKFGWNAYLAYNPLEQRLYAWDNGNQVTYEVTLADETSK